MRLSLRQLTRALAGAALLTACGSTSPAGGPDAGTSTTDAGDAPGTDAAPITIDAGPTADAMPQALRVDEAFASCTAPGPAGGLGGGDELMRIDIDTSAFPSALCNDGTGAVMYVRRARDTANADKWVLQLQGGGACSSSEACAERWCSVDTNFGALKMSNRFAPARGTNGRGVLANRSDNPFDGWNHVFLYYCSSDSWSGTKDETTIEAAHPRDGGDAVPFRIRFNGANIVEAVVKTLRRDGVSPTTYQDAAGSSQEMPDLDNATHVVLAGASAGGGGVVNNLDWLTDTLTATNTACGASTCPLEVFGIIDSSFPPSLDGLDFSATPMCTDGGNCSADAHYASAWQNVNRDLWDSRGDESCVSWNDTNATGQTHWCTNKNFVIANHLTTPFVVRMGLTDSLVSGNYVEAGFKVPSAGGTAMTTPLFADLVASELRGLPAAVAAGNEAASVTKAPGVFAPPCPKHETLSATDYYSASIGSPAVTFPQLLQRWYQGTGETVLIADEPGDTFACE